MKADNETLNASTAPGARPVGRPRHTRSDQRDQTRLAVLEAAIRLFAERGYEGASLPIVAKASGVPVPLIVYHFKTKELLWREAVGLIYARVERHIGSHAEAISAATGRERYRRAIRAHITAVATHPEYMRIFVQEGTQRSERLRWMIDTHQGRMTEMIVGLIQEAQADGLLPAMDPMHAKFILSGAFSLAIVLGPELELVMGEDPTGEAFIERHIALCMTLLMPEPVKPVRL